MKAEVYNLVCKGELIQGFKQSDVISKISQLFKVDEAVSLQLLNKKHHIIKKNVNWQQALQYRKALKDIGLIVDVNLIFDADIFRESLVPARNQQAEKIKNEIEQPNVVKSIGESLEIVSLEVKNLIPALFAKPNEEAILDKEESAKFHLTSYNHFLNPFFLLIMSAFVALMVQKYFTLIFVQYFSDPVSTTLSIIIFFTIIIFLPRIMTPNRIFTLHNFDDDSAYLLCAQISSHNPFVDEYHIYSHDEEMLATVTKNKINNNSKCFNTESDIIFSSSEEHNVDDATRDVASEIRDNLFDFSVLEYLNGFSKVFKAIKKNLKKVKTVYFRSEAFVIRDDNGNKVAYFMREANSFIEYPSDSNNKSKILLSFLLLCVGVA